MLRNQRWNARFADGENSTTALNPSGPPDAITGYPAPQLPQSQQKCACGGELAVDNTQPGGGYKCSTCGQGAQHLIGKKKEGQAWRTLQKTRQDKGRDKYRDYEQRSLSPEPRNRAEPQTQAPRQKPPTAWESLDPQMTGGPGAWTPERWEERQRQRTPQQKRMEEPGAISAEEARKRIRERAPQTVQQRQEAAPQEAAITMGTPAGETESRHMSEYEAYADPTSPETMKWKEQVFSQPGQQVQMPESVRGPAAKPQQPAQPQEPPLEFADPAVQQQMVTDPAWRQQHGIPEQLQFADPAVQQQQQQVQQQQLQEQFGGGQPQQPQGGGVQWWNPMTWFGGGQQATARRILAAGEDDPINDQSRGWDRFKEIAEVLRWDHVVEAEIGNPTQEELQAIVQGGYYGKNITEESVEALKAGRAREAKPFSMTIQAVDGQHESEFDTREELIAKLQEWGPGEPRGQNSFVSNYGEVVSFEGVTYDEAFPGRGGHPDDAATREYEGRW